MYRDKSVAVVIPAHNEELHVALVIEHIPSFVDVVIVVDDASTDGTADAVTAAKRANVVLIRRPRNGGMGTAIVEGFRAALDKGVDLVAVIDADGQMDSGQLPRLLDPIVDGDADIVVGTRFGGPSLYRGSLARRIGIGIFARAVSAIVGRRITDTTSGFRAMNRRGIRMFATDYPHDYPEVEATVLVYRHGLRLVEVPVAMRQRESGRSSITAFRSLYYMGKVSLALFVGLLRPRPAS